MVIEYKLIPREIGAASIGKARRTPIDEPMKARRAYLTFIASQISLSGQNMYPSSSLEASEDG